MAVLENDLRGSEKRLSDWCVFVLQPQVSSGHVGGTTEEQQLYWAKGTGFGTGSTASGWDVEQALTKQRLEEEHVTCLLQVGVWNRCK